MFGDLDCPVVAEMLTRLDAWASSLKECVLGMGASFPSELPPANSTLLLHCMLIVRYSKNLHPMMLKERRNAMPRAGGCAETEA